MMTVPQPSGHSHIKLNGDEVSASPFTQYTFTSLTCSSCNRYRHLIIFCYIIIIIKKYLSSDCIHIAWQ